MGWVEVVVLVLKIALNLFTYFTGKAEAKAAAAKAIADQFALQEKQGHYIMRDILVQQGRSSWIPWDQVPRVDEPPAGPSSPGA